MSQNEDHAHSRIQYQSQKVFLENRFNLIQIRNVLPISPKPPPKFSSWYMKSFLGKLYETTERHLRISSVWICQKVHKWKLRMSELFARCLGHSLWRNRRGGGATVSTCGHVPSALSVTLAEHTEATDSQGEHFMEQRATDRSQKLGWSWTLEAKSEKSTFSGQWLKGLNSLGTSDSPTILSSQILEQDKKINKNSACRNCWFCVQRIHAGTSGSPGQAAPLRGGEGRGRRPGAERLPTGGLRASDAVLPPAAGPLGHPSPRRPGPTWSSCGSCSWGCPRYGNKWAPRRCQTSWQPGRSSRCPAGRMEKQRRIAEGGDEPALRLPSKCSPRPGSTQHQSRCRPDPAQTRWAGSSALLNKMPHVLIYKVKPHRAFVMEVRDPEN